mgnify:CR=1 FL=1
MPPCRTFGMWMFRVERIPILSGRKRTGPLRLPHGGEKDHSGKYCNVRTLIAAFLKTINL